MLFSIVGNLMIIEFVALLVSLFVISLIGEQAASLVR